MNETKVKLPGDDGTVMDPLEKLEKLANMVASDIMADHPAYDVSYNMYVEELRDEHGARRIYGVIDMGEMYQRAFVWVGPDWEEITDDPYEMEERILRKRGNSGW